MSIALVAHVSGNSTASTQFTTAGINTTGATLLIANISFYNNATNVGQITDSNKNTWTPLPIQANATNLNGRLYYSLSPVVGAAHTFTLTTGSYSSMEIAAFSGVTSLAPLDTSAGASATAATIQGGSLTPANANSLMISGMCFQNSGPSLSSVGSGYTITDTVNTGSVIGSSLAYLIETSIVAQNPLWTFSASVAAVCTNAVFIAGSTLQPTSPAVVASVNKANVSGTHTITTSAIDTTGATLIIVSQSAFTAGIGAVSDSKSNTWVDLTSQVSTNVTHRISYCINPTVGSGHTFTITNNGSGSMQVIAISGTAAFDTSVGSQAALTVSQFLPGSVTPAVNGSIIVSGVAGENNTGAAVLGIDKDFRISQIEPSPNGVPTVVTDGAIAFLVQNTAAAVNPTWFFTVPAGHAAGTTVVFKPSSGALTQTLSDTLVLSDSLALTSPIVGSVLSDSLSLSDALASNLSLLIQTSDTLVLSDLVASTLGMIISDTFTLSDLMNYGLSLPLVVTGDSLSLSDAILFIIGVGLGQTDTITFSDVLAIGASVSRKLGDNILLSDFLVALVVGLPLYSDSFALADSAQLALSLGISSTDSLVLSDAVQIAIANNLILAGSDSLSLSDAVVVLLSGPVDQYIRHWLNDVPR